MHLLRLAAKRKGEIPLAPPHQLWGEHKGTGQKQPGVLYTSQLSPFTPFRKSALQEDGCQVSLCLLDIFLVCVIISIYLCHFFPWWVVERSTGTPRHPQRGDGVFLTCALAPKIHPGDHVWSLADPKGSSRATSLFSPQCVADSAIGGPWPGGFFPP